MPAPMSKSAKSAVPPAALPNEAGKHLKRRNRCANRIDYAWDVCRLRALKALAHATANALAVVAVFALAVFCLFFYLATTARQVAKWSAKRLPTI